MKIVIVDDDDIVLMSLKMILEAGNIEVVAVGKNGEDAVRLYEELLPDILLSDIRMAGKTGIEAAYEITKKYPDAKILFLTTFSDDEYVISALKCHAKGYILKQDFEGIVPAVNAVYSGQSVFGGEIIDKIPNIGKEAQEEDTYEDRDGEEEVLKYSSDYETFEGRNITEKEYEVICLVAEGYNNKEIASKMFLSEGTVRNYVSSILDKLELRDRTQLVVYFYKKVKM